MSHANLSEGGSVVGPGLDGVVLEEPGQPRRRRVAADRHLAVLLLLYWPTHTWNEVNKKRWSNWKNN